jgi:hypothetical protein
VGVEIHFPQYGAHNRRRCQRPIGAGRVEVVAENWGWERDVSGRWVGDWKPLTPEGMRHVYSQLVFHASDKP